MPCAVISRLELVQLLEQSGIICVTTILIPLDTEKVCRLDPVLPHGAQCRHQQWDFPRALGLNSCFRVLCVEARPQTRLWFSTMSVNHVHVCFLFLSCTLVSSLISNVCLNQENYGFHKPWCSAMISPPRAMEEELLNSPKSWEGWHSRIAGDIKREGNGRTRRE